MLFTPELLQGQAMSAMNFQELVTICTSGQLQPYDYQQRIAEDGLPEVLVVPTGAGKTMAVVLAWLYRRRFHPDLAVRAATPRWLVICQPMRTLVEQVRDNVDAWLTAAGCIGGDNPVERFVFMGGEPTAQNDWRLAAHRDAVIIGTQDMLLSRALNRGFGSSRYLWPVEFGLFNTNCHWVYDEIQLMGPGVPTGRQLEAFRAAFPASGAHGSTWMSATVAQETLKTVDNPDVAKPVELSESDRSGPLAVRLQAAKTISELVTPTDSNQRIKFLAAAVVENHKLGTLTLCIVNTVRDAQAIHEQVLRLKLEAEVILLHSRFRRADRKSLVREVVSARNAIVISTQVVEAGMDLDATTLITEAAPWPSIVQRLGRCNRAGLSAEARAFWFAPAKLDKPKPYEAEDIAACIEELRRREGQIVVPDGLAESGPAMVPKLHPVLRRKDLLGLFDTLPDITGSDIDVSPYVRDLDDDRNVSVAWRILEKGTKHEKVPTQAELCPAPLSKELSDWIDRNDVYRYDFTDRTWVKTRSRDVHPNQLLIADPKAGGYTLERGWEPSSKVPVPAVVDEDWKVNPIRELDEAIDDDSASVEQPKWVTLETHLLDTERAAVEICGAVMISEAVITTLVRAARLHDIGKAHAVFQNTMERSATANNWDGYPANAPLAKAKGGQKHKVKNFRHELASALALLSEARPAIEDLSLDHQQLCIYVIAAHHGRIRATLRSINGEPQGVVFGITDADTLPSVTIGSQSVPGSPLTPSRFSGVGSADDGTAPWQELSDALLTQHGPFQLAFFETLVRLADWKASSDPSAGWTQ
jgi:CRISPR-associated endonuclease/helicase Cas3